MDILSCAQAVADTHHRIQIANSSRRLIKVVGIGQGGAAVARSIGNRGLHDVQTVIPQSGDVVTVVGTLQSLNDADMLFLVARDGDDLALAPAIRQAVRGSGVLVTGVLIQEGSAAPAPEGLATLRAATDMLVIATDESYVVDMLVELGA
ncbi:MAG: hypothetical protein JWM42_3535 [Burkholderia sp.]|nr:hypothetical protein [Burkholderia sp.]